MRILILTVSALICFALNSILCRIALRSGEIDAATFTAVRIGSGALVLALLARKLSKDGSGGGSWRSSVLLLIYAVAFAFAYLELTTATGALILFGSVQVTMVAAAVIGGDRLRPLEIAGIAVAFAGLVYLVLPGLESPPIGSSLAMAAAGSAWGFYTLSGRGNSDPIAATAGNFTRAVPFVIVGYPFFAGSAAFGNRGILLAAVSGALASGIGYLIWFKVLEYHTATRAAVVQLAVPAIAAAGGVVFLDETFTLRLLFAGLAILGGILLTIQGRSVSRSAEGGN